MEEKFRLNIPFFLMAFSLGILYVYLNKPPHTVVIKHPTPENAGKIVYKDKSDNCFIYDMNKVKCPENGALPHPINN